MLVKLNWPQATLPPQGSRSNQLSRRLPLLSGPEGEEARREPAAMCQCATFSSFPFIKGTGAKVSVWPGTFAGRGRA